jgi:hypothetical protein
MREKVERHLRVWVKAHILSAIGQRSFYFFGDHRYNRCLTAEMWILSAFKASRLPVR